MIPPERLQELRLSLRSELGDPDSQVSNAKGDRETWMIGTEPRTTVTYRSFSASGGPTIDINGVDGVPVKRFHITGGGQVTTGGSYADTIDYLRRYAADDWLSLSTVLVWANGVAGAAATVVEIVETTVRLASDLIAAGAPAGDLVPDDRDFVPWLLEPSAQLDRIRSELQPFVDSDRIPADFEICWFHRIDG